jgi:hypothetical protein
MAYEFQKLSEVEALAEVPEGANALIEVNGDIKRVPGSGLGGATGIKTAIIKSSDYDDAVAGLINSAPRAALAPAITYECLNMTFEEAYETMRNGEPLQAILMLAGEGAMNIYAFVAFLGVTMGTPCIVIAQNEFEIALYWTANGISTEAPMLPK